MEKAGPVLSALSCALPPSCPGRGLSGRISVCRTPGVIHLSQSYDPNLLPLCAPFSHQMAALVTEGLGGSDRALGQLQPLLEKSAKTAAVPCSLGRATFPDPELGAGLDFFFVLS